MYFTKFFLLLFLSSFALFAKQSTIKGYVFENSGAALPYVNMLLLKSGDSSLVKVSVTDESGMYAFDHIPDGSYVVSARMIGYQTKNIAVNVAGENVEIENITLSEGDMKLNEVVVTAARPMIEVKNSAVVLNVASSPILNGGTAFDAVQRAPGVTTDQNGKISLKGRANVNVMIDGKMTYLSAEEVLRLLQNTPANNIESIEIMENPPAKYDAAGNAGIINIKFKRPEDKGLVGNVNFNAGYGTYYKAGAGLNLNYRSPKLDILASYNNNFGEGFQNLDILRKIPVGNEFTVFTQDSYMKSYRESHNVKFGIDYNISSKTSLGAMFNAYRGFWTEKNNSATNLTGVNLNVYDRLLAANEISEPSNNFSGNLHFKHQFNNKGTLTLDADYSKWYGTGSQNIANRFYKRGEQSEVTEPLLWKMDNSRNIDIYAVKADYTQAIDEKTNFEAGVKSSFVRANNELFATVPKDGTWVKDDTRSNDFNYAENIYAAYLSIAKKVQKFNFSLGLRGEYTYSNGFSPTLNQRNEREYMSLFPNLSVSYAASDKHQFGLTYGRRIDRPNYRDLNPFVFILDKYTYNRGNPFLNPQFTNTVSASYTFMGGLNFSLSYGSTNNAITQVLEQDNVAQATYQTNANLNKINNYSLAASLPLPLTKWWFMYGNLTAFYTQVKSPFSQGTIDNSQFSVIANINNSFTLPKGFKLELTGMYQSPLIYGIFEMASQYQADLGVSRKFGNWTTRISVSDFLNTRQVGVRIKQGTMDVDLKNKWETRVARINLTYQFGNNKIKMSRGRKTGIDDVEQRAK